MLGSMNDEEQQGVIPRAMKQLFGAVANKKKSGWTFTVQVRGEGLGEGKGRGYKDGFSQ